jgi:large subunit ribosomal protein L23
MDIHSVIVRPLVTEKGTRQSEKLNAYAFEVHPDAPKALIKQAVEKLYEVKVLEVRTANRKGKPRRTRMGRSATTKHWKKAVCVLHPDHHIDLF